MLDTFRRASKTWPIKFLFALLILSFGIWGVGDVVRSRVASQPAITVGGGEVSGQTVADAFRRDFERLQAMFGGKLTQDQARQFGLINQTVRQLVSRELLNQEAERLKLTVDDDTLRATIAKYPAFQNELKVFDKSRYEQMLARAGISERQLVSDIAGDLLRGQLATAVTGEVRAPRAEVEALFRYRQEKRVAETIAVPLAQAAAPPAPDEAALRDYYKAHSADFTAPELRGISAVVLRAADVAGDIHPSDADVEKAYQVRQAEFSTPEKRKVEQVLFSDQAQADAFARQARGAADFAAAAKAAGKEVTDLGWTDRAGLPLAELGDAAFGLPGAGVADPVQTPLGWHVVHVAAVAPGKQRPLADVRSIIVQDLVKDEATNRLYQLSTKLEDAIGSGAGIDEAAGGLGVKPLKIAAVDASGLDASGKPVPDLPQAPAFLAAAFQTPQGGSSEVQPLDGNAGYFVLHVDSVTPSAVRPFEAVKDKVAAGWTLQKKREAAHAQAQALADRLAKGEAVKAVAGALKVETTQPFLRADTGDSPVPPALAAEMFHREPGGVAVVDAEEGSLAARLIRVIPADRQAEAGAYDHLKDQLGQSLAGDMMAQYVAALEKDIGVTINNAVIDRQFEK